MHSGEASPERPALAEVAMRNAIRREKLVIPSRNSRDAAASRMRMSRTLSSAKQSLAARSEDWSEKLLSAKRLNQSELVNPMRAID
jgi:hypothetical protein